jgi:hypothetical protein
MGMGGHDHNTEESKVSAEQFIHIDDCNFCPM